MTTGCAKQRPQSNNVRISFISSRRFLQISPLLRAVAPPPNRRRHDDRETDLYQHLLTIEKVRRLALEILIDERTVHKHHRGREVRRVMQLLPWPIPQLRPQV